MNPQPRPNLAAVVAMAENRVIGRNGTLPWKLPEDLRWFQRLTTGGTLIMGRKTYDSIGRPLPNRRNIVLSRSDPGEEPGIETFADTETVLEAISPEEEAYVIGGAEIYRAFMPFCRKVFLSRVDGRFEGDTFLDPFEHAFPRCEELFRYPGFSIFVYSR